MITYINPDTGYQCKAANAIGITEPYREVSSHERDEFNEAIDDYDAEGAPIFDMIKAKGLMHNKRRNKRMTDFKPHDAIISLQIPGQDAANAEVARTAIRLADATLQSSIDACTSIDELKAVVI